MAVRPRGEEGLTGALETPVAALCPGSVEGVTSALGTPVEAQAVTDNPQTPKAKEENVMLDSLKNKLANKQIALTPEGTKQAYLAMMLKRDIGIFPPIQQGTIHPIDMDWIICLQPLSSILHIFNLISVG